MMLRNGSTEDITEMFDRLKNDARRIIKDTVQLVYYMRGAIGYEEALMRTPGERDIIVEFISERLEQEAKKLNPVY